MVYLELFQTIIGKAIYEKSISLKELEKYNLVIKDNIGLRLQSRLTKEQAKMVASCNAVHRDISLNF